VSIALAVGDVNGVASYVNDFRSVVAPRGVAVAVGNGSYVQVSATGPTQPAAVSVLRGAVTNGLEAVADQLVAAAQQGADSARSVVDATLSALTALEAQAGATDAAQQYQSRSLDVLNLENQLAAAEGTATPAAVGALRTLLRQKEAALAPYARIYLRDQQLQTLLSSQDTTLAAAQQALADSQARAASVRQTPPLVDLQITRSSTVTPAIRLAVIAGLAALLLVLAAAVLFGRSDSARRRSGPLAIEVEPSRADRVEDPPPSGSSPDAAIRGMTGAESNGRGPMPAGSTGRSEEPR
jgi:hypothetical protein